MVIPYLVLLGLVVCERFVELAISRRNAARAFAAGGIEVGRRHFGFMVVMQATFLLACAIEVAGLERPFLPWLGVPMLLLFLGAQGLRYWIVATLGRQWNVRVIVVPGAPLVTRGPYRILRHPNYVAVAVEIVALPLIHTAWLTAAVFTVLNAWVLLVRIRVEEAALRAHGDYETHFGALGRFVPRGSGTR